MSLRSPIPVAIREQLAEDPFMKVCLIDQYDCSGRIEWQHFFTYGGKRQSEIYGILPLCHYHHVHQAEYVQEQETAMKLRIHDFHAEADFRAKYPKSNLLPSKI